MADVTSRALDMIIGYAGNLRTLIPAAKAHLDAELHQLDGMPTVASGADTGPGGQRTILVDGERVAVTSVEAIAIARLELANTAIDFDDRLHATMMVMRALLADTRRAISTRIALTVPRCSAVGREGAFEWARPDCWDAPVRGPLCFTCYQRERRWREQAGLPARGDAA
jgi:hypothetical protein